jgi:hypothetical protein
MQAPLSEYRTGLQCIEIARDERVRIRFNIEQRHLTDDRGKPVTNEPAAVSFHNCEAETADEAVRLFVTKDGAELIGSILKFPGFQAVATVRKTNGVYTLQVSPSSQNMLTIG